MASNSKSDQTGLGSDRFFQGVRAYFVESGVQARRLKIWSQKIQQFGGTVENQLSHETTHAFALSAQILQEKVNLQKLKHLQVKALTYEWIQDCLKEGLRVPLEPYVLKLNSKRRASTVDDLFGKLDSIENAGEGSAHSLRKKEKALDTLEQNSNVPSDENVGNELKSKGKSHLVLDERTATKGISGRTSSAEIGSDDSGVEVFRSSVGGSDGEQVSPSSFYIPPNLNENITERFTDLRDIYKDALGDERRSFSYHKALSVLEKLPFRIDHVDQLKGLPSIGKSIQDNIHEILTTGRLTKLENLKNDERVCTLILLSSVWGVGPVTARKLYEKGVRSLEDLNNEPSLTPAQRVGLRFRDDINAKIPRHEVKEMETLVKEVAEDIQPGMVVVCGGSYRRGKSYCGDMDFVMTHPDGQSHRGFLLKLVAALKKMNFLTEDLIVSTPNSLQGNDLKINTFFGLCKYPGREQRHRIDLKVYPIEMYAFGLIAWTGNDVLNRRLRLLADKKGFKLDDKGLFPVTHDSHGQKVSNRDATIPCKSEKEVFDLLGFPWLEPHERNL